MVTGLASGAAAAGVTPAVADGIFCPACGLGTTALAPGPGGRPAAACPSCGSLERHRLLALLLRVIGPRLVGATVLDIAPSPHTTPLLARMPLGRLVGMDFDPGADGRSVDVRASVTDLPFADDALDFALCYHVFEHVPEDRRGMAELARVLRPSGFALVQVPWHPDRDTDEETEPLPVAERLRRFGQRDHVRYYGRETFDDRLRESGLEVYRFLVRDLLAPGPVAQLGLRADEAAWLVRPLARGAAAAWGSDPARPGLADTVRSWVDDLLGPGGGRLPDLLPELVVVSTRAAGEHERADGLARDLGALRGELAGSQVESARSHADLASSRTELARSRAQLASSRAELARSRAELARSRAAAGAAPAAAMRPAGHTSPAAVRTALRVVRSAVPAPVRAQLGRGRAGRALRRVLR